MILKKVIRVKAWFASDDIEKEMRYQLTKAYVELCRDLEHAGLLKVTDMARTDDSVRKMITIEIPDKEAAAQMRWPYEFPFKNWPMMNGLLQGLVCVLLALSLVYVSHP